MESSVKDKYIILGFVGFAIVLISSFATLVIADNFNQDNFVRWIVFVCCNLLGWLLYLSFQTLIFDTYEIYKIKFGKKETVAEAIEVQEELPQNTLEETTSESTFRFTALTSIPENLFANCPAVTNFGGTFSKCKALIAVPKGLFVHNPKVTDFEQTFEGCSALTAIPEKLFANNPEVTKFSLTFHGCSALTTIPENLFANNSAVTTFSETFYGCKALIAIPENLFANNPKATAFNFTFVGCTSLTSIPTALFDNNRKVTDFAYTFASCKALTGESPYTMIDGQKVHLYERKNYPEQFTAPTGFQDCFYDSNKLTDYAQIPTDWL